VTQTKQPPANPGRFKSSRSWSVRGTTPCQQENCSPPSRKRKQCTSPTAIESPISWQPSTRLPAMPSETETLALHMMRACTTRQRASRRTVSVSQMRGACGQAVRRKEKARSGSDPFPKSSIQSGPITGTNRGECCSSGSAMTVTERLRFETVTQQTELSEFGRRQRGDATAPQRRKISHWRTPCMCRGQRLLAAQKLATKASPGGCYRLPSHSTLCLPSAVM
jgi:hypothetical protein